MTRLTSRQRAAQEMRSTGWCRRLGDASDHRRDQQRERRLVRQLKEHG